MSDFFVKPTIRINFNSSDGNIFYVLASASKAIKLYEIPNAAKKIGEMKNRVTNAQSYEEALEIIKEYVTILPEENWI